MRSPASSARVGCDLVDLDRFRRVLERNPWSFREQLFTPAELRGGAATVLELALCFAVKEAVLKALRMGLGAGLALTDVSVQHEAGAARVRFEPSADPRLSPNPSSFRARVWLEAGHAAAEVLFFPAQETPCASS